MKMLTMIESANSQYSRAVSRGFGARRYCKLLVNKIGNTISDIAVRGSIISVRNAIAAAGRPIPKKPLIIPEKKNTEKTRPAMPSVISGNKNRDHKSLIERLF